MVAINKTNSMPLPLKRKRDIPYPASDAEIICNTVEHTVIIAVLTAVVRKSIYPIARFRLSSVRLLGIHTTEGSAI